MIDAELDNAAASESGPAAPRAAGTVRRELLARALGSGIVLAGAWVAGCGSGSGTLPVVAQSNGQNNGGNGTGTGAGTGVLPNGGSTQRDIDILNFALHLEYLDSEYYTYATSGRGIETFGVGINGQGTQGATVGGARVTFDDPMLADVAAKLAADERAQVNTLREMITMLGGTPIAKPALDLANPPRARGIDPTTPNGFLLATRDFEDTGLSAYAGTSQFLANPRVVFGSARLLAVEASHAGAIRHLIAMRGLSTRPLDGKDILPPPSGPNYFPADARGESPARTPREVLAIVLQNAAPSATARGGFFPAGLNGDPARLTALLNLG